jgi:hypothetical protein
MGSIDTPTDATQTGQAYQWGLPGPTFRQHQHWLQHVDLGAFNIYVALTIAVVKAMLSGKAVG